MNMQNENPQFNNDNKKYFTIVPNYIIDHSASHEKSLYLVMKRLAGESGTCWASPITLGKIMGVSPNTVRKYRKILAQKAGLKGWPTRQNQAKRWIQNNRHLGVKWTILR